MDCQLTLRQYLPTLSISFLTLTTSAHPLNNLIHYAKITHLVPKSAHTLPTSAHTSKCLLTLPNICNTINTLPPPPILCQNLPNISSSYIMSTYDHIWPHSANICPSFQHLPTLCQHLSKPCQHLLTLCQNLRTLTHTMPTSRASLLTLCQYLRTISTYAHTMPACCQRLPTLLDIRYFNIVVILTWKVPSLHKVCLRRNVKSGVFTLMPIS